MSLIQSGDRGEGRQPDIGTALSEKAIARERVVVPKSVLGHDFIKRFVEGRVFEWVMSLSMALIGLEILLFAQVLEKSAFKYLLLITTEAEIGVGLLMLGWVRISALMLNGQKLWGYKAGPFFRAIGSVASSVVWAQFVIALLQLSVIQGRPSPGLPFWFMCTLGEIYVAYQTVKNA